MEIFQFYRVFVSAFLKSLKALKEAPAICTVDDKIWQIWSPFKVAPPWGNFERSIKI